MGIFANSTQESDGTKISTYVNITGTASTVSFRTTSSSSENGTTAVNPVSSQIMTIESDRVGASFSNDGDQVAYILLENKSASLPNGYTVKLPASSGGSVLYETPFGYTGAVNVIFEAAGTGNLVWTKFTF
jgi:hypothetical protein